jgi:hypothetical protein
MKYFLVSPSVFTDRNILSVYTEEIIVGNKGIKKEKWYVIIIDKIANEIYMLLIFIGESIGNI